MTIPPGKLDLKIYQGAALEENFAVTDSDGALMDFTGYSARAQAREEYESASPFMDLTTGNGGITLGGAAGTIALYMSAAATAAITATGGYWDLELVPPNGRVIRILQGEVCVSKEVTR